MIDRFIWWAMVAAGAFIATTAIWAGAWGLL